MPDPALSLLLLIIAVVLVAGLIVGAVFVVGEISHAWQTYRLRRKAKRFHFSNW